MRSLDKASITQGLLLHGPRFDAIDDEGVRNALGVLRKYVGAPLQPVGLVPGLREMMLNK